MGNAYLKEITVIVDDDTRLIQDVKHDTNKFSLLYDKYVDIIYKYFLSRVQNQTIAEDLTSDLFFNVLKNIDKYKHRGQFKAWIFTIARNMFYKHLRKPSPSNFEELDNMPSPLPMPEQEVTEKQTLLRIRGAINTQPELDQELFRLRFVSGLKFSEIGIVIGKSETATKKHFYRLLEKISSVVECEK